MSFTCDKQAVQILKSHGWQEIENGVMVGNRSTMTADDKASAAYLFEEWDFVFEDAATWLTTFSKDIKQTLSGTVIKDGPSSVVFAIHPKEALKLATCIQAVVALSFPNVVIPAATLHPCETCGGTGKESRHQLCRDCD